MGKRNEYVDYLLELMQPLGHVTARPMFGGFGMYADGLFFAIVVNDVLYFKVDDVNRGQFTDRKLDPFTFDMKGEIKTMNYHRCPEEALENPVLMAEWGKSGIAAAMRAQVHRRPKAPRKTAAKKAAVSRPKRKKTTPT